MPLMADEPENLTLRYLRSIDTRLDGIARDIAEIKASSAGMLQILASHDARLLRVEERLDRIDRRIGLIDPAIPAIPGA
jgi:hypothetical protein